MPHPRLKPVALPSLPTGETFVFTIHGAAKTKKNSQRIVTNKTTGKQFIIGSVTSRGWEREAVLSLKSQWHRPGGIHQPVSLQAVFYRDRAVGDLGNFIAGIADALEKAGVITNDRWIVSFDGSRLRKDADDPRVEITLTTMLPDG